MIRPLDQTPQRIAVIGAGVAGLTAAHLLNTRHRVTLFEKNRYLGGHTHTVEIPDGPDAGTPVDTGFIVMNDRNYPLFRRLGDKAFDGNPSIGGITRMLNAPDQLAEDGEDFQLVDFVDPYVAAPLIGLEDKLQF
jgi:predicted NAD/FAD-dependent oxidoreductase